MVDQTGEYRFYIGTQLGDAGTTVVCENCKSAIRFYWPGEENEDSRKIQAIIATAVCPVCNKVVKESEESKRIKGNMALTMAKFKHETGQSLE
jgi:hypothetical protein